MDKPEQTSPQPTPSLHNATRLLTVSGYVLSNVLVFGGIGYWVDGAYGTKPWAMIAGLIIAFPLSQVMIYKTLTNKFRK